MFYIRWCTVESLYLSDLTLTNMTQNPRMNDRLELLKHKIEFQMNRIKNDENNELLEITYLFYDEI